MSQNIAARVMSVLRGSAHVVLDKIEDKAGAAVLKEHIREVETALDAVSLELGKEQTRIHHGYKQEESRLKRVSELDAYIRQALMGDRRDLAEVGVAEKLRFEKELADIQASLEDMRENEHTLYGYKNQLKERLSKMEAAYESWLQAQRVDAEGGGIIGMVGGLKGAQGAVETAERHADKFNARLKRDMGIGMGEIGEGKSTKLEELEELAHHNAVAAELARYEREIGLGNKSAYLTDCGEG